MRVCFFARSSYAFSIVSEAYTRLFPFLRFLFFVEAKRKSFFEEKWHFQSINEKVWVEREAKATKKCKFTFEPGMPNHICLLKKSYFYRKRSGKSKERGNYKIRVPTRKSIPKPNTTTPASSKSLGEQLRSKSFKPRRLKSLSFRYADSIQIQTSSVCDINTWIKKKLSTQTSGSPVPTPGFQVNYKWKAVKANGSWEITRNIFLWFKLQRFLFSSGRQKQ